jgi:hypothetical protein
MKHLIGTCALIVLAVAPARAEERYDRKLEQAAMQIVAENIGDIRGGFSYAQKPQFVVVQDALLPDAGSRQGGNVSPSVTAPAGRPNS